jgi:hypothetical protein
MKQSSALILAAIVTAFVLVVVGGVTATLLQPAPAQTAPTTQGAPTAQPAPAEQNAPTQAAPAEQVVPAEQPAPAEPVSREQAIRAATDYVGGGTVREAELEREDGRQVYEVEFANGSEVYVDAQSGQVVYAELSSRPERENEREEYEEREHEEYEEHDDE